MEQIDTREDRIRAILAAPGRVLPFAFPPEATTFAALVGFALTDPAFAEDELPRMLEAGGFRARQGLSGLLVQTADGTPLPVDRGCGEAPRIVADLVYQQRLTGIVPVLRMAELIARWGGGGIAIPQRRR